MNARVVTRMDILLDIVHGSINLLEISTSLLQLRRTRWSRHILLMRNTIDNNNKNPGLQTESGKSTTLKLLLPPLRIVHVSTSPWHVSPPSLESLGGKRGVVLRFSSLLPMTSLLPHRSSIFLFFSTQPHHCAALQTVRSFTDSTQP